MITKTVTLLAFWIACLPHSYCNDSVSLPKTMPIQQKYPGLSLKIIKTKVSPTAEEHVTVTDLHIKNESCWRSDFKGGSRGLSDGLWFTVSEIDGGYQYNRVGFSNQPSTETELLATSGGFLESGSHILDSELVDFLTQDGMKLGGAKTLFQFQESDSGVDFDLTPADGSGLLACHGTVEWLLRDNFGFITGFSFTFGDRGSSSGQPHIVEQITYETKANNLLLPVSVFHREKNVEMRTEVTIVSEAPSEVEFYGPEAFGLQRPVKPWPMWAIWGGIAAVMVVITILIGRFRSGT